MKKSVLKTVAVLSTLAVGITAFTACNKEDEPEGSGEFMREKAETKEKTTAYMKLPGISTDKDDLLYQQNGKIYYREHYGETAYELVTDNNGVTVVDEQGNLIWKLNDEQTHPVSYPAFLEEGDRISCQQFTLKLPKGWGNKGNAMMQLRNEDETIKIDYSFFGSDENGVIPTAESKTEELKTLMKPAVDAGKMTIESSETQVAGRDAAKVLLKTYGENLSYLEVYFIDISGGVMSFSCSCQYEEGGKFDFKAILDTIEYRVQ